MKISNYFHGFIHLFLPDCCICCGRALHLGEVTICLYCQSELPRTRYADIIDNNVEQVLWGRVKFVQASAFLFFSRLGMVQRMIHALKYKNRPDVGELLGWMYGHELHSANRFSDIDLIIPVPLHLKKRKVRGYNQAEVIARGMSKGLLVDVATDVVVKIDHTTSQTRKNRIDRWRNVESIFKVVYPEKLQGKHVLIVDDVITTGATLEAVCATLSDIKDVRISIAALTFPI